MAAKGTDQGPTPLGRELIAVGDEGVELGPHPLVE
jgi:hypothetical protein